MSDAKPVDPKYRDYGLRLEAVKLRFEGGKNEHMALAMLGDEQGLADNRQKMHDLMDVFLDIATEAVVSMKKDSAP